MSREHAADHLLVECAKWHGGVPGLSIAVGPDFDPEEHFAAQVEAFVAVGLLDGGEADDWRRRFAETAAPEELVVDAALQERIERYLDSLLRMSEGDDRALQTAVNVLAHAGALTDADVSRWFDRMIEADDDEDEQDEGEDDWPDVGDRDLRRVVLGPERAAGGVRVVSAELYPAGLILRWTAPDFADLALADDAGTAYRECDVDADGDDVSLVRGATSFAPAVPEGATRLLVAVAGQTLEIGLSP
ncbi:MAG TPA: hypothetical protein VJT75_16660 [Thermoleophilaceae bacterium]|nr:hypothetical protein [Thermoleophilaceae bacterium]